MLQYLRKKISLPSDAYISNNLIRPLGKQHLTKTFNVRIMKTIITVNNIPYPFKKMQD